MTDDSHVAFADMTHSHPRLEAFWQKFRGRGSDVFPRRV
jgi:hypothetical protein